MYGMYDNQGHMGMPLPAPGIPTAPPALGPIGDGRPPALPDAPPPKTPPPPPPPPEEVPDIPPPLPESDENLKKEWGYSADPSTWREGSWGNGEWKGEAPPQSSRSSGWSHSQTLSNSMGNWNQQSMFRDNNLYFNISSFICSTNLKN